jgi:hypothetical protein
MQKYKRVTQEEVDLKDLSNPATEDSNNKNVLVVAANEDEDETVVCNSRTDGGFLKSPATAEVSITKHHGWIVSSFGIIIIVILVVNIMADGVRKNGDENRKFPAMSPLVPTIPSPSATTTWDPEVQYICQDFLEFHSIETCLSTTDLTQALYSCCLEKDTIPSQIGLLTTLTSLSLYEVNGSNDGELPSEIGLLTNFERLSLEITAF